MAIRDLTIKKGELEEKQIERLIKPYARYDVEQKKIFFLPGGQKLGLKKRIVLFLVAIKGWRFFEKLKEQQFNEARPREIAAAVFEKGSTVRNHLQALRKSGIIHKTKKGGYMIPNQMFNEAEELITNNGAKEGGEEKNG